MNRIFCPPLLRTIMVMALVLLGVWLSGCADMSDTVGLAFADPERHQSKLLLDRNLLADHRRGKHLPHGVVGIDFGGILGNLHGDIARERAARPRQTIDEAGADRVGDEHKYDRHGAGRLGSVSV